MDQATINVSDMSNTLITTPGGRRNSKIYEPATSSDHRFINKIRVSQGEFEINLSDNVKKALFEEFMQSLSEVPVLEHKCNSCGGTIELNANKHIFMCPYCGRTYAIGTTMINDRG